MASKLLLLVVLGSGCILSKGGDDDEPLPRPEVPAGCIPWDVRDTQTVNVSGQVLDFVTAVPVAGATVEVTTAWDLTGNWPPAECPMLATLTTDREGRFSAMVPAGSNRRPPLILFLVSGAGRAPTASDNRACAEDTCNLGHTIAAPTTELVDTWRGQLAAGGMPDAATRGLVAFRYKSLDGNAAGVVPDVGLDTVQDLVPGTQVRFLDADRRTMMPATHTTTSISGMAIVGVTEPDKTVDIGGRRATQRWASTGCLVEPGWLFLEDRTGG